jgi:YtkA-like
VRRVLLAVGLLLVFAPAAHAGGWATVGLSSTPQGMTPGKTWVVDVTVLQHGVTPLTDVKPVVTISSGSKRQDFAATPTGKPGVYRASVVFPAAGRWEYQIDDGFISQQPHTYPAVQIGGASATTTAAPSDGGPNLLWLIPGVALLLAAAVLLVRPRLRHSQQPQAA